MGLKESTSLWVEISVEVRLFIAGSPQTPRKRDPHWEFVVVVVVVIVVCTYLFIYMDIHVILGKLILDIASGYCLARTYTYNKSLNFSYSENKCFI